MKPAIYRHRTAGWCLAMPGHDPIELPTWQAAVDLLRQLDDRPAPVTPAPPLELQVGIVGRKRSGRPRWGTVQVAA